MISKYKDAPLGRRVAAKFTDVVFAFFASAVISALGIPFQRWSPRLFVIISLSGVLFILLYLLLADGWSGHSVGRRIFGLKVVDHQSGSPCTLFQSFVRNIAGFGFLRILQLAEEEGSIEAGRYNGTVVIDVSDPKRPPSSPPSAAAPPRAARLDLEGIADYVKRKKSGDS